MAANPTVTLHNYVIILFSLGAHRSETGVRSQQIKDQVCNQQFRDCCLTVLIDCWQCLSLFFSFFNVYPGVYLKDWPNTTRKPYSVQIIIFLILSIIILIWNFITGLHKTLRGHNLTLSRVTRQLYHNHNNSAVNCWLWPHPYRRQSQSALEGMSKYHKISSQQTM